MINYYTYKKNHGLRVLQAKYSDLRESRFRSQLVYKLNPLHIEEGVVSKPLIYATTTTTIERCASIP